MQRNHLSTLKLPMVVMETGGEIYDEEASPISTDYTTACTDDCTYIFSKEEKAKKFFHIYLQTYSGNEICCEILAINEMEAIGMALSHYQYYSACDIIDIKSQ